MSENSENLMRIISTAKIKKFSLKYLFYTNGHKNALQHGQKHNLLTKTATRGKTAVW